MANFIKSTLAKLKLIDNDEELEQEDELTPYTKKSESSKESKESLSLPKRGKIVNIHTTTQLKVVVVHPENFEDSKEIADHLKKRNTVVVNMKRVTAEQAKRIIDFLSGTVYAIGGDLQKIGVGIFLCTPKNVNVEGSISDEDKRQEEIED